MNKKELMLEAHHAKNKQIADAFKVKIKERLPWINVDDETPPEFEDVLLLIRYETDSLPMFEITLGYYNPTMFQKFHPTESVLALGDCGMYGETVFRRVEENKGKIVGWTPILKESKQ